MPSLTRHLLAAVFCLTAFFQASAQISEVAGTARFEAENPTTSANATLSGVVYQWSPATDVAGYSGTGFLQATPDDSTTANSTASSPQVTYTVNISNPGTYYIWLRAFSETAEQATAFVALNSGTAAAIAPATFGAWAWTNSNGTSSSSPIAFTIPAPGNHTLRLWMADAGFRVDRILLTSNPNFSPAYSADFWRNQNIYQIITDRFFDGDSSNNTAGLPNFNASNGGQAHGGDFRGIEQKLDYIKALGATAIWISPVLRNANGDYHGYAATDFYQTNPRMGSLTDLQRLVAEAHRRGILVINDVVVNHGSTWVDSGDTGWAAFRYPPSGYNLRYNSGGQQYAAPFDNSSLTSRFGNTNLANIFHNNGGTQNWGDPVQVELGELLSLDDFKTETPYIREKMREIWTYWMNAAGFDAYRIDTVKHVEMGFWDDWSPAMRAAAQAADRPNFFQFGEVFDGSDAKVGSYTGTKTSGIYKMESVLDYPLYYQIGSVFATATGNTGQIESRYLNLTSTYYDPSALDSLVLNIDNHDNPRFLAATGSTPARLELALAFLYTSRGIPSLYYGTEQDFNGGVDPANREDMFDGLYEQGPSLGDNFNITSARFKLVAKLNNLRRLHPALRTGSHNNLWANFGGPGLLAYARRLGSEEVYVVINTATTAQTIGARPTIHPAGTVLTNVMNPAETVTVTTGADGIPSMSIPATSFKIFIAQNQLKNLNPVVNSASPAHDASGISPAAAVSLTFSQPMSTNSTQAAFSTTPPSTGTFAWTSNNTTLTYTPSSSLAGNTTYAVHIGSNATDSLGTTFHAPFETRFRTGAPSGLARPSINSFSSSAVTDSTATLTATVTPNGAATNVNFEYGTSTAYGSTSAIQSIGSGNSPATASANLSGLTPGTEYHYRTVATNSQGTTFGPDAVFTTDTPLPQATTGAASFITPYTASLNGAVNPNGLPTTVYFQYGVLADKLTSNTTSEAVGNGTASIDKWAPLSGLEPDTTYFFCIVAKTGTTEVRGAVQSFHTIPVKPTVSSSSASPTGPQTATLSAEVNPNGSGTTVFFEYGNTTAYGSTTAAVDIGSGNQSTAIVQNLNGLSPGVTYRFRAVAQNTNGTTYGPDQSFSTGYPPPSVVTGSATASTSTANLTASINPNGPSETSYWFEYGPTTAYGFSTRSEAWDDAEGYTSFSYSTTSTNATVSTNGGSGFGSFTSFVSTSSSRGGIRLVTSNSTNGTAGRQIESSKSFGVFAGTSTTRGTHSGRRAISTPRQSGQLRLSARFDISNEKGFTGFNLKSAAGSSFGANELLSFGMMPGSGTVGGNTSITVTDAAGQRNIDLGTEIRGAILDFQIDFDTKTGAYTGGVKLQSNPAYQTLSGALKSFGPNISATTLGYMNGNNNGSSSQHLIFDNLRISSPATAGSGTSPVPVAAPVSSLTANTTYHYRAVASNSIGTTTGASATFFTGATQNAAPVISPIPNQSVPRNTPTSAIPFTVSDAETPATSLTISAASSNKTLVPDANITFSGNGSNRTLTITPTSDASGNSTITISVSDGTLATNTSFLIIVNSPPSVGTIANQTIKEDTSTGPIAFTVSDVETPAESLTLTASSSNTALLPVNAIALGGTGQNRTLTATSAANQAGNTTISVNVGDGTTSVPISFLLTVNPVNDAPTISALSPRSTPGNTPAGPIPFTISDPDGDPLLLTASSDNQLLVPDPNITFSGSGSNRSVTVTPAENRSGAATINVTVSDGALSSSSSFVLTVGAVNGSPTISPIANQATFVNTPTTPIAFTIGDNETAADALSLTVSSTNQTLIPDSNITLGGNGTNRTVTINPANNQTGNSTIAVTVNDGTFSATRNFLVTVSLPPDISLEIPNGADSSAAPAYGNGTFIAQNGGSGFGSWTGAGLGFGGSYIGGSGLGNRTLAIYAGGGAGNQFRATRPLAPALAIDETFSAQLGYTGVATGGEIGVRFLSANQILFTLKFVGGGSQWMLNDGGSDFGTGISWSGGTPLSVAFTRHTSNGYSIRIQSGSQFMFGNNFTGSSGNMTIDSVEFYSIAQGGGENLGFDNLDRSLTLANPTSADLGASSGNTTSKIYNLLNTGAGPLTNLAFSKTGNHASEFNLSNLTKTTLAPGEKTAITASFLPAGNGNRTASIQISSNDPDENPFTLNFSGSGSGFPDSTPFQSWTTNAGLSGDDALSNADPDGDGLTNFLEFAFGLDPKTSGARPMTVESTPGSGLKVTFLHRNGVNFTVKTCTDLSAGFSTTANATESPNTSNLPDGYKRYEATFPGTDGRGFLKIESTAP